MNHRATGLRRQVSRCQASLCLLACCCFLLDSSAENAYAQSALPLLSGFDEQRVEAVFPIRDEPTAGEAGKLVYRLRRIQPKTLEELEPEGDEQESNQARAGDVRPIEGVIREVGTWPIPDRLIDFLEFDRLQEVVIDSDGAGDVRIITTGLASDASEGDRVSGTGVIIESGDDSIAVAAGRLKWFPRQSSSLGIKILAGRGVDAASLADLATRDRLPLVAEDADAFYPVLRVAGEIASSESDEIEQPEHVDPVALLSAPNRFGGQWLRMTLSTVRITRIAVTDPHRRQQLGSDHYFQVDSSGDLDNVVVSIARPEGDDGAPIQFENNYPVSLAIKELPSFLRDAVVNQDGKGAVSTMISRRIQVDGFFLRLWSYESDFMQRQGGGKQFGPLIVASRITDLEPNTKDPIGVRFIGWAAAAGVFLAITGIVIWSRVTSSHDRKAKQQRKALEAERIDLPGDAPDHPADTAE